MGDAKDKKSGSKGFAAILFVVWAIILLIAFLANRGSDVGQLQNLVGNLGGGPLFGGFGIQDSFVGFAVAVLIVLAWFGFGSFVFSLVHVTRNENRSMALEFAIRAAVGAAIWSLIWFFLGLTGAYNQAAAVIALATGTALLAVRFRSEIDAIKGDPVYEKPSGLDKALIAVIAIPVLLALTASLAPPTAKDTLLYHFALPKAYIAAGNNGIVLGNIASYLALGAEMHNVWAMLLGGLLSPRAAEAAAGATSFMFFPILLTAVYGWSRESKIERRWSLLAVLLIASVPTAYHVAASAYIDLALALYVTLAIYALGRWWNKQENGWLVFIAIVLGAALSIKLTSLVVVAAFALMILLRARQAKDGSGNVGKIFASGFAALVLSGMIASPWYLRTWKATGSPVFPFYMSIWKGDAAGWDVERSTLFQAMNSQYGGIEKNALDYVLAPLKFSIMAQPEQSFRFDGVVGVAFLIGLPLLIWGLWKFDLPIELKVGLGVCGVMFLFWLFSSQQLRYLLPILPVLAIGIVLAAEAISKKIEAFRTVSQATFAVAGIAGILVIVSWFLQTSPLRVVFGGETRDQYLARNLDYYAYYRTLNTETTLDSRVWLINMRRDTYNLDRPVFSDYLFEDWTLRKIVWEARNVQELRARTAAMGIKYVLARHDFLFDYAQSALVDDKKPRAENEAKMKLAKDFILDPANTVRSDGKFSLIKVFTEK